MKIHLIKLVLLNYLANFLVFKSLEIIKTRKMAIKRLKKGAKVMKRKKASVRNNKEELNKIDLMSENIKQITLPNKQVDDNASVKIDKITNRRVLRKKPTKINPKNNGRVKNVVTDIITSRRNIPLDVADLVQQEDNSNIKNSKVVLRKGLQDYKLASPECNQSIQFAKYSLKVDTKNKKVSNIDKRILKDHKEVAKNDQNSVNCSEHSKVPKRLRKDYMAIHNVNSNSTPTSIKVGGKRLKIDSSNKLQNKKKPIKDSDNIHDDLIKEVENNVIVNEKDNNTKNSKSINPKTKSSKKTRKLFKKVIVPSKTPAYRNLKETDSKNLRETNSKNLRETDSKNIKENDSCSVESNLENTVLGRETEYLKLKSQISYFKENSDSSILYLTGVPGSGKTFTVSNVFKNMKIKYSYINCAKLRTKSRIYSEIGMSLKCNKEKLNSLHSLRFHFNNCSKNHYIVLDEVDLLFTRKETYLYNLFEMPFHENSKILMIVISNTLNRLSSKLESRIGKNRIDFKPYTSTQLFTVMKNEFKDTDNKSLELISKKIATTTGDIRKVKNLVKKIGSKNIKEVNLILKDESRTLLQRFIQNFSIYHKLLIFLNKDSTISVQEWYNSFIGFCLAKDIPKLDFSDFMIVLNDLIKFGIYKLKMNKINTSCYFLLEEIEQAIIGDDDFNQFGK